MIKTAKHLTGREVPDSELLLILHPSPPQRGRDHSNTLRLDIYRERVHREGFKPYSIAFYFIQILGRADLSELQARYSVRLEALPLSQPSRPLP